MATFFGCFIGTFLGNLLYKYVVDVFARVLFNYKFEKGLERDWF